MSNFDNEVRVTLVTLAEITKDEMVRQVRHRAAVPNPDQLKAFPFLHLLCKVPAKDTVLNDHGIHGMDPPAMSMIIIHNADARCHLPKAP